MSLDFESRQAIQRRAYIHDHCDEEPMMIALALRKRKLLKKRQSPNRQAAWIRKVLGGVQAKEFKTPSRAMCLGSFGLI